MSVLGMVVLGFLWLSFPCPTMCPAFRTANNTKVYSRFFLVTNLKIGGTIAHNYLGPTIIDGISHVLLSPGTKIAPSLGQPFSGALLHFHKISSYSGIFFTSKWSFAPHT
jgi:hypothetical protein